MSYHLNILTHITSASTGAELKRERLIQLCVLDGLEEGNWRQGDQ